MKKRKILASIIMTAMMAMMLAGCAGKDTEADTTQGEITEQTQEEEVIVKEENKTEEVEAKPEEVVEKVFPDEITLTDAVFDYYATEEWQKAYRDVLKDNEVVGSNDFDEDMFNVAIYGLYDIDKDGTPELLIETGTCEADYKTNIYTYKNGEVLHAGLIYSGHSQLYTNPDSNGIIQHYAHMGWGCASLFKMEDGKIPEEAEILFEDDLNERSETDINAEYLPVTSVVEEARLIPFSRLEFTYGLLTYNDAKVISDSAITHEDFEKKINAICMYDEKFFGVKTASYWEDADNGYAGEISLMDILEDPELLGSTSGERVVKDLYYGDFDHDGYEECLAVLEEAEYENKQLILFTYQNERIYGYTTMLFYGAEFEVADDNIYLCQSYGCARYEFSYCLDQCSYDGYLVDHAPMSETALESLERFRQDLKTDNGELGVCFLGWSGTYSEVLMDELIKEAAQEYQDEEFMRELNRCSVVSQPGEEVFLLIPGSSKFTISVYEVIWGDDTEDGMPQRGELLYKGEPGELVIVRGNQSDIVSNLEVSLRANARDLIYNPCTSLENGKVQTMNKVVDITRYH